MPAFALCTAGWRVGLYFLWLFFLCGQVSAHSVCVCVCVRQLQQDHVFRAQSPPVCQPGKQPGPPAHEAGLIIPKGLFKRK